MALVTERENLVRSTMYIISPALAVINGEGSQTRSRLYHPHHQHLFRHE
jgi:precorrin-4/cobalt-precorrin-4 C11-methyltransferase